MFPVVRSQLSGKKRVSVRERHCGVGAKQPYKDCGDNVGKDHLLAGTDNNLQRPIEIGTTEVDERRLAWRMSQYER